MKSRVQPFNGALVASLFCFNDVAINVLRYHRTIHSPFANGANAMRFNPPNRRTKLLERPRNWHFRRIEEWEKHVEVAYCILCLAVALAGISRLRSLRQHF